jgi:Xaa-Pro aminopeptidase
VVALLRRATRISGDAIVEALRSAEPGMNERDIEALVLYIFRREGADRPGYPSIVGSGPNSCILHYHENERTMAEGDLVVLDVGAEYRRYTADVTRTFPVSGRFTAEQRRVYEAVLRAQDAAIAAVRPGARISDVHAAAWRSLDKDGLARHFPHGTSHWLGLDVHDVGRYETRLAPGMVLTVEPGAYLADTATGVRIEDDVLVTEDGCEVLTGWIPRDPDEIERLMAEKGLGNVGIRPYKPEAAPAKRARF